MPTEQIFIGATVALLCLLGFIKERWLLEHTRKGRWLAQKWGEQAGLTILRCLLGSGALFGILLACNVIRPVQW